MTQSTSDETEFLETVTRTYATSDSSQDRLIRTLAMRTFRPYLQSEGTALELGCSYGFVTSLIADVVRQVTVVDGSMSFIEMARQRVPKVVVFIHSLFEDYKTESRFDYLFATYVLEHVRDPIRFLAMARNLLNDDGLLFLVVPNARALSRQLARHMGLLGDLYALTPNDIGHGHRRVYDRVLLNRDLKEAGLQQVAQGGLLLKPFADFQMDKLIEMGLVGSEQQEGLYQMGLEYPDLAGSLFSICKPI